MAAKGISFEVQRTPPDRRAPASPEQVPVLQLRRFAPTPKVSFGMVKVGSTRTVGLIIQNPGDQELELLVEKVPDSFSVQSPSLLLPPLMDAVLPVHWTPELEGNVRGVLGLSTSTGIKSQAILLGTARPLQAAKKRKSVASAPGSRFRKPQPLRSLNSSSARSTVAAKPSKPRAAPRPERENRAPPAQGRASRQPAQLRPPAAGPLNSTHRLETSADCSTLLDVLRTPPDFSVSLIRTEDAPGTPARRREGRAGRPIIPVPDPATPRRQTFEAQPPPPPPGTQMGSTFRLDPRPSVAGELPPCTVPQSPMRRQTFVRTDGPTLGAAPSASASGLDPVQEGDADGPGYERDEVFETPQLFRRRQPAAGRKAAPRVAQPEVSPEDWMRTPALFGKTITRELRVRTREERSERREEHAERHEGRPRAVVVEQAEQSRRSTRHNRRSAGQPGTCQSTRYETKQVQDPTPVSSEGWMKTPSLFGKTTAHTETRETDKERCQLREEAYVPVTVAGKDSRQGRFETSRGVRFEVHDDCFGMHEEERLEVREGRPDVREEERFEVHEAVCEEVYEEEYQEVHEVREERLETVQYTEEGQEYGAIQTENTERDVIQTPQLFGQTRPGSRREQGCGPPATPITPLLRVSEDNRDAVQQPEQPGRATAVSLRDELMMMPTPQLFGRMTNVSSAAESHTTSRRAIRSETLASSATSHASDAAGAPVERHATEERATCVHEEVVEEETLIRHVFTREIDPAAPVSESPRLLRSCRSSRTEETRCYGSPVRGVPDLAAVLGSPGPPPLTPTGSGEDRRCSTLVKQTPSESPAAGAKRSAAAKELFASEESTGGVSAATADAAAATHVDVHVDAPADGSSDVSGNLSSETYVKSPAPAGLEVPFVPSPPAPCTAWPAVGSGGLSLIREESENVTATSTRNLTYSLEETREEEVPEAAGSVGTGPASGSSEEARGGGSDHSWVTVDGCSAVTAPVSDASPQELKGIQTLQHQHQQRQYEDQQLQLNGQKSQQQEIQDEQAVTKSHVRRPTGLLFFPLSPESAEIPPPAPRPPVQPSARAMAVAAARRSVGALARREAAGRPQQAARTPSKRRARRPSLTVTPGKAKVVRTRSSPAGSSVSGMSTRAAASSRRSAPAPVRQRRLVLSSRSAKPVATQPNPFAASNMFYDKDWVEKQERGFTAWLNFILTPSEFSSQIVEKKVDAAKILLEVRRNRVPPAPTRETLSLREYTAQRRLNRLRLDACRLYERPEMTRVIRNLEVEVERGGLRVRRDRALHADMGLKQLVMQWLLSYHPLWLRLGLETIYGEIIHLQGADDLATLARFINTRLLWSPDLAARHRHPSVPHLYGPQFEPQLKQFTLKKFLLLVLLLDTAKRHRLIRHDPCLFNKQANIKASRDLLVAFSREMLAGEGDITKHLSFHGYQVSHRQTLLDEFNYAVTNIATDLRCGVRLTRVVELLRHQVGLTSQLRVPAVDRQQKIHNSRMAVRAAELQLEPDVWARALVDGHREKTLHLLWLLVFRHQIDSCVDVEKLRREVSRLETSLDNSCFIGVEEAIEGRHQLELLSAAEPAWDVTGGGDSGLPDSESLRLLTRWARLVCAHYGLPLHNLSASFGDGRPYCYLLHHYQPTLLARGAIRGQTSLTARKGSATEENLDDSLTFSYCRSDSEDTPGVDEQRRNEKHNLNTAFDAMSELGGVPVLSSWTDYSATLPDRRLVAVTLAYLCGRLLELGAEVAAARTLQLWWRRRRLAALRRREKAEAAAAVVLQRHARRWLASRRVALRLQRLVRLQAAVRGWLARRRLARRAAAATVICRRYRALVTARRARAQLERQRVAAERLQRWWRHLQLRRRCCYLSTLLKRCLATSRIQRWYRGCRVGAAARAELQIKRWSVVTLQRWYRSVRRVRSVRRRYVAAIAIQTWYRAVHAMRTERSELLRKRRAAVSIQAWYRSVLAEKKEQIEYKRKRRAAQAIQAWYRSIFVTRKDRIGFLRTRSAAASIQAWYRAILVGKRERKRGAALAIQTWYRSILAMRKDRNNFLRKKEAALSIQTWYHAFLTGKEERTEFLKRRRAATTIQAWCRAVQAGKREQTEFLRKRRSARTIQSWYRSILAMRKDRINFFKTKQAAVLIQTWFRAVAAMKREQIAFLRRTRAGHAIQAWFRAILAMRNDRAEFLRKKQAAVLLQVKFLAMMAMWKEREAYLKQRQAAATIQSWYRSLLSTRTAREEYLAVKHAATVIQTRYRATVTMRRARAELLKQRQAVTVLQTMCRALIAMRTERRAYLDQIRAATTIQLGYRAALEMRRERANFHRLKEATVVLQTKYRALRAMKVEKENYFKQRRSAAILQAWWRSVLARNRDQEEFQRRKLSVITLQTRYRALLAMQSAREEFSRQKKAAATLQTRYRALLAMRSTREDFLRQKRAAAILQAFCRAVRDMRMTREAYLTQKKHVITIQRWYRSLMTMRHERTEYLKRRQAAMTLQHWYRSLMTMRSDRAELLEKRRAAVALQTWYRGRRTVRRLQAKLRETVVKVTIVQSCVRTFLVRRRFVTQKRGCITIQRGWRSVRSARRSRDEYLKTRGAVVAVQRWYRSLRAMRKVREGYERKRQATVFLQTWCRSLRLTRVTREEYLKKRQVTVIIQMWYRSLRLMHVAREEYKKKRQAAITLQMWYRSLRAMRETLECYERKKQATIILQTWYHSMVAMRNTRVQYMEMKRSAINIQRWYRHVQNTRKTREQRETLGLAIIALEPFSGPLGAVADDDVLDRRSTTTLPESSARGSVGALPSGDGDDRGATVILQESFLERQASQESQKSGESDRRATVVLQESFLERQTSRESQSGESDRRATVVLQEPFLERQASRGSRESTASGRRATVVLQESFLDRQTSQSSSEDSGRPEWSPASSDPGHFSLATGAAATTAIDATAATIEVPLDPTDSGEGVSPSPPLGQKSPAAGIASGSNGPRYDEASPGAALGGYPVAEAGEGESDGAEVAVIAGSAAGAEGGYVSNGAGPGSVDAVDNPSSARSADDAGSPGSAGGDAGDAASPEEVFRACLASQLSPEEEGSLRRRTINPQWRTARRAAGANEEQTTAAVALQRVVRRFLYRRRLERRVKATVVLQSQVRRLLARRAAQRRLWAVVTLQAAWRGRAERRRAGRRAARARQNIAAANRRATTDMTLGSRTSLSLDFLLRYRDLGHMKVALGHLEAVTRLSAVCCRRVVDEGVVPVLYTLMSQCNRSVPHMDVISLSLSVLLHAARHPETENTIHQADNWLPVLLDKMSIFREKGAHIFIKAATLLTAILRDPFMVQVVLADARTVEQLRSLHRLVARRHQQQQHQHQRGGQRNTSTTAAATAAASAPGEELHVGRSRLKEFGTPVAAAAGVLAALGITP